MQCVILAGGLGTRMRQFASKIPKCLIEINHNPFIHYQLTWLSCFGVTDIVLCIGHLGNMVRDYVQNGTKWNLNVNYVEDGNILLGTGGALRKAFEENMLFESFLITYGDSFLPINFESVFDNFLQQPLPALMTVFHNEDKFDKSNATINNGLVFYDKSKLNFDKFTHIDYGLTALHKDIVKNNIPSNQKFDLSTLFHNLSVNKTLAGYEVDKRFYEIGSPSGLKDFTDWINND